MRALVQRVTQASVSVDEKIISQIGFGMVVLLGIRAEDTQQDTDYMIKKLLHLRIFQDAQHKMNESLLDVNGEILLISQFTLYGHCKKGNRPSFVKAMPPAQAEQFYAMFVAKMKQAYNKVQEGIFGANMQVSLINDGPVTIVIDSK